MFYDHYSTGAPGDVEFYVEEAQKTGSPVLEIGCGTGRVLIPVAEAGVDIVGLDRAPSMLALARDKVAKLPAETRRRIEIVPGDMRRFDLGRRFNMVMIPYRAFLHMLTTDDQRRTLGCIRDHLADGGKLVLNNFDPRLEMIVAHQGALGAALKLGSEFIHARHRATRRTEASRSGSPAGKAVERFAGRRCIGSCGETPVPANPRLPL